MLALLKLLLLFHGAGGGSILRLGVGKLPSGLTVSRVVELSSPAKGGGSDDSGGVEGWDVGVLHCPGRTVEREEVNEVEVPLLVLVPVAAEAVTRRLLFCSSAFGVEASGVAEVVAKKTLALWRMSAGQPRDGTRLTAPGGTEGLCRRRGGHCGEPGRTAWIMGERFRLLELEESPDWLTMAPGRRQAGRLKCPILGGPTAWEALEDEDEEQAEDMVEEEFVTEGDPEELSSGVWAMLFARVPKSMHHESGRCPLEIWYEKICSS